MRNLRKLVLLAIAAVAAIAFAAPAASAQVEVTNEATGAHCPAVSIVGHQVSGGCGLTAHSNGIFSLELFGSPIMGCLNEFDAAIGENGAGAVYNQTLTGVNCSTPPCEETAGEKVVWPIQVGEPAPGQEHLNMTFCVNTSSGPTTCSIELGMFVHSHASAEFAAALKPCAQNPFIHVTGTWDTEADNNLEITH